jgi:hypothetical protein
MAGQDTRPTVTLNDLVLSSLISADAIAKLLIRKGLITEREMTQALREESGNYHALVESIKAALATYETKAH